MLKQTLGVFGTLFRGPRYNKAAYVELLGLQFSLFKLVQAKGMLALEPHIENPDEFDDLRALSRSSPRTITPSSSCATTCAW